MLNISSQKRLIFFPMLAFTLSVSAPAISQDKIIHKGSHNQENLQQGIAKMLKDDNVRVILLIDQNGDVRALSAHPDNKKPGQTSKIPQGTELTDCKIGDQNCNLKDPHIFPISNIGVQLYPSTPPDPCLGLNMGGRLINVCW